MVVTARSYSSYSSSGGGVGFGASSSFPTSSERPKSQILSTSSRPSPPKFGSERLRSNGSGGYYTIPKLNQSLPPAKQDLKSLSCRSSPGGFIAKNSSRSIRSTTFPLASSKAPTRRRRNLKRKARPSKPLFAVAMEQVTHSPVVQKIQTQTRKLVEDMEERQRQLTAKRRISEALIGLRAASERSLSLRDALEHDNNDENQHRSHLRDVVGDVGLALFSPLDDDVFREGRRNPHPGRKDSAEASIVTKELHEMSLLNFPVELQQEPPHVLRSCPRLLNSIMIRQLVDDALPTRVKTARWNRVYCLDRDGDAFISMLDHCRHYKDTLLVLQTSKGHLLGGYAAAPWNKGYSGSRHFYGNGESLLFASDPADKQKREQPNAPPLYIYKWTGSNLYSQICDIDHQQLAMGGGGAFGLIIQDNFSRGSTGRCSTFGNPPLVPHEENGLFKILALEVYGFSSSMMATTTTDEHLSIDTT